nr:ORF3 [Torque teno felis virus]
MPYGERCRAALQIKALYPMHPDPPVMLKPESLLVRGKDPKVPMISGPEISTPMASSKGELLKELLSLIQEISEGRWETKSDDLNLSLNTSDESLMTEGSSSEEEWEITPPNTPP